MNIRVVKMGEGAVPQPEQQPAEVGLGQKIPYWLSQGVTYPLELLESLSQIAPQQKYSELPLYKKLLGGPAYITPQEIAEARGIPFEQGETIGSLRQKFTGLTPEQVQPEGFWENLLQKGATQGPTSALFGLPSLATTLASAVPAAGLAAAGAPPLAQDVTQLAAGFGLPYLASKAGLISNKLPPTIAGAQKAAYEEAKGLVPEGERFLASTIDEGIKKTKDLLSTETEKGIVDKVTHIVDKIKENLYPMFEDIKNVSQRANPSKIMDLRKSINKVTSKNKDLYHYTKPLLDSIDSFFAEYSTTNPEFFSSLKKADQLTAAKHMKSYVEQGINKLFEKIKIPYVSSTASGALKATLGTTVGEGEKLIRKIVFNEPAREVYFNLIQSIAENNPAVVAQNLTRLFEVEKEQGIIPEKRTITGSKISFRVVQVGDINQ